MLTALLAVIGAGLGALVSGPPGLLFGGALGFLVGQQIDLRRRLKEVEEAQSRVHEMQAWATEMKQWAQQTHAWLLRLGRSTQPAEAETTATPPAEAEATATQPAETQPAETQPESTAPAPAQPALPAEARPAVTAAARPDAAAESPAPPDVSTRAAQPPAPAATSPPTAPPSTVKEPPRDPISWVVNWVKQWVTTGNAPVKVGVLVSLVGVGLLLREAHRRGIIELTIEVRLAAAAVFGLVLLAVGWRQRNRRRIYGVSLQGGGVAVLYVTAYAAFAVYDVLAAVPAASAVVIITAGAGMLSVVQDARPLAVLGIIGGFLAPVLTYSQPEDHVFVFAFFAVLNAAIFAVAWFKTWPELNLLGFGFTFGLTAFWLSNRYEQDEWVSAQPFIALFVLMYVGLPALFAVREAPDLKGVPRGRAGRRANPTHTGEAVARAARERSEQERETPPLDPSSSHVFAEAPNESRPSGMPFVRGTWTAPLVFGTPFIGLGLQQLAVGHLEYGLAVSAAALAAVQGGLALAARRLGADRSQLVEAYAGLGVVFSAIAVPLALDAYYTSTVWAAQGLFLVWLGLRRSRLLALSGGAVLQVLAALSLAVHLGESLPYPDDALPIVNEHFLGALALAVAGLVSGWLLSRRAHADQADHLRAWVALGWGTAWWLAAGLMEIVQQLPAGGELSTSLAFMVASFAAGSLAARRLRWPQLEAWGLLVLPTMAAMLVVSLLTQSHPLDRWGWAVWPPVLAAHYLFLRRREASFRSVAALLHAGGCWILAVLVAVEVYWQVDGVAEGVWPFFTTVASVIGLAGAAMAGRRRLLWPVAAHWRVYLLAFAGPLLMVAAVVVLGAAVSYQADPRPLLYLPVLNPLTVLVGVQLAALLAWRRLAEAEWDHPFQSLVDARWAPALAGLAVVLATTETSRTVSHWLDVPWDLESLWDSTELQTSLSILWAVIALSSMVAGVRMVRRSVWVAGASWMAVVVAKLFLVDLRNLTALGRVVSFIVVGVLLLIVGYLAPVPPAASGETDDVGDADEPAGIGGTGEPAGTGDTGEA